MKELEHEVIPSQEKEPTKRIAFLGPTGTFTEEVTLGLKNNAKYADAQLLEAKNIEDIFTKVQQGKATYGIVPVENSTDGPIKDTMHGLLQNEEILIAGEAIQDIRLFLFTAPSADSYDIHHIASKDTALWQSQKNLRRLFPHIPEEGYLKVDSTAFGVKMASEKSNVAAVASKHAAESLGLTNKVNRSEESIEDNPNNATTFAIITKSQEKSEPTGNDKTTFIMDIHDAPGGLHSVLVVLAEKGINLTKIKSVKKADGKTSFFVSIDGHQKEKQVKDALISLNALCPRVSVRGSYPKTKYIPRTTLRELDMLTAIERIKKEAQNGNNTDNQTIVFTLPNEAGSLANALEPFAQMGVNLTVIDSQPSGLHDQYIFYLAYDRSTLSSETQNYLLQTLSTRCTQMVLLETFV